MSMSFITYLFFVAGVIASNTVLGQINNDTSESYTFAVVPKLTNSLFYDVAKDGCNAMAASYGNVVCKFVGPPEANALEQAEILEALIDEGVDGVSVAVLDEEITGAAIKKLMDAGIPVITFDSDAPNSERIAAIGTDNKALGSEIAKVLLQLRPEGGKYGVITGLGPNLDLRVEGVHERLKGTKWVEAEGSPADCEENNDRSIELHWEFAANPEVSAMLSVGGWPMGNSDSTTWKDFVDGNRHVTTVVSDATPHQLSLMGQGYVSGLVGQLPYQMGEFSIKILMDIKQGIIPPEDFKGTHLLEVLRVPLILPKLEVNKNYIGNFAFLGYLLFGIVASLSLAFGYWVYSNRRLHVVRASQPMFLIMICAGTFIMGAAIIPTTFDDEHYSQKSNDIGCMSFPWLLSIGFTTVFSALFSKTWRVNKIFHNPNRFKRIEVRERDVIVPYLALLSANIIVLMCWTIFAPLRYVRSPHLGTDDWNRVISTYGTCSSEGGEKPYLALLAIINAGVLLVANMQAYNARKIKTEFSESRYIAIVMASMLQTFVIAIPVLFLVHDLPAAYYIIVIALIFVTCSAVLYFIFVPKLRYMEKWKIEQEKKKIMREKRKMQQNNGLDSTPSTQESNSINAMTASASSDNVRSASAPGVSFTKEESFYPQGTSPAGVRFTMTESFNLKNIAAKVEDQHQRIMGFLDALPENEKLDVLEKLKDVLQSEMEQMSMVAVKEGMDNSTNSMLQSGCNTDTMPDIDEMPSGVNESRNQNELKTEEPNRKEVDEEIGNPDEESEKQTSDLDKSDNDSYASF